MRIDRLELKNFKRFEEFSIDLHPQFTLLVGENGSGKTSILDALAVALGVWLVEPRELGTSYTTISRHQIRLSAVRRGDRLQLEEHTPTTVSARGVIRDQLLSWTRELKSARSRGSNSGSSKTLAYISELFRRDRAGERLVFPVIAYYGAGRAWLPSQSRRLKSAAGNPHSNRWSAFYSCLSGTLRFGDLLEWFERETLAAGSRGGRFRQGYHAINWAVRQLMMKAESIRFEADLKQLVATFDGRERLFDNLSAGEKVMLSLVADLAIKMVAQNAFLLSDDLGHQDASFVLRETPGVVLIDELDVHLHPRWQRRVAADLMRIFPKIQFVCTSHSPQIIGELKPENIRMLTETGAKQPPYSFGVESSRVLEELMDAPSRNENVARQVHEISLLLDAEDFVAVKDRLSSLEATLGHDDPDVVRVRAAAAFLGEDL